MAKDRANDSRRKPNLNLKPGSTENRSTLIGAPGSTAQPAPGRTPPEGGSYIPTSPAKKEAFNPNAIATEINANNFNAFSSGPSTRGIRTRFEGE